MNRTVRLANVARDNKKHWLIRIVCGLAVVYLVMPLDFLPDLLPVIGWIDDLLVLLGTAMWVINAHKPSLTPQPVQQRSHNPRQ